MNKIQMSGLDTELYEEVLDNGLRVYLCNIPRHTIHARMTSFFGGSILEFKLDGESEFTRVPGGIAHFLEHKMFEKKGYDPLALYEGNGAKANAFTNEFITSYHFSATSKFYDNLKILLNLVHDPYFTDENVLKEKGIISQEKKEDMDSPFWITYDQNLLNTFFNLDFKNTVLGSLEDINSITKEDLYKCYNTFYHPSNMVLTIAGDIDVSKTIEFIKKYYDKHDFGPIKNIVLKKEKEPLEVVKEKEIIYKETEAKEVSINYKIKKPKSPSDRYLNRMYFSMIIGLKFSGLSSMLDKVAQNKNFLSGIYPSMQEVDDFYIENFHVTVKDDTKEAISLIDKTLKKFDITEEKFNLYKKVLINSLILSMEDPSEICSILVSQIRLFGDVITDVRKKLNSLNYNDFKKYYESVSFENRSVFILQKKDD